MGYKTADSIEAQEERKQARDNGSHASTQASVRQKLPKYDASRIKAWQYKPGQSGNPGGKPKIDLAAEIARACFENNREAVYKALSKALLKGNGYVFKELADRGYGKLKEVHQVDAPFRNVPAEEIEKRMQQIVESMGYVKREEPDDDSNSKPN